jgi:hypothetical protein
MYRWTGLWALGAVLLIAGGVLLFVPAVPNGPHTVTPPDLATQDRWYYVEDNVTGFTVTGNVPFTLDWSSSAMLYLDYAVCPRPQSNFSGFFNGSFSIAGCNEVYGLQGSSSDSPSGALSTGVPAGGSVVLAWGLFTYGPHNISITYTFWTGLTIAGPVLLILGLISIGLGVVTFIMSGKPESSESKPTEGDTKDLNPQAPPENPTKSR